MGNAARGFALPTNFADDQFCLCGQVRELFSGCLEDRSGSENLTA
jgi:hypothetical protein